MKLFDFFAKKKNVKLDDEVASTVGMSSFWVLGEKLLYNEDKISLETYKRISRHYQVSAALAVISYSIQQIDWFIQADNATVKEVTTVAIEKIWNRLIRAVSKSFVYGYSPCVKVFTIEKINGKEYIVYKKIKDLNPSLCQVKVDDYGNYDGFVYKKGTLDGVTVKPDYSFWYTNDMENGNHYGKSMLKTVYKPWWYNEKMHQFANRYYERFGEPLVIGRSPSGAKVKDISGVVKEAQALMREIVEGVKNHTSVTLPSDKDEKGNDIYELKYLESQMRGFDFENYFRRLDMEILRGLFLPDLILGGERGGSYALGAAQMQVFYTNLMGIMDNIVDYVNLYILPQIVEFNFEKSRKAKFTYQPLSGESKKNIQEMIMQLIKNSRLMPDVPQLEERSGFKFKEEVPPKVVSKEKDLKEKRNKIKEEESKLDDLKKELMDIYAEI